MIPPSPSHTHTHTQPMRIHVSEATAELLQNTSFEVEKRGRVEVKVNLWPLCMHGYENEFVLSMPLHRAKV